MANGLCRALLYSPITPSTFPQSTYVGQASMETLKLSRLSRLPAHLTKNAVERARQGALAQTIKERTTLGGHQGAGDRQGGYGNLEEEDGETARKDEEEEELGWKGRLGRWMVNEGPYPLYLPSLGCLLEADKHDRTSRLKEDLRWRLGLSELARSEFRDGPLLAQGQPRLGSVHVRNHVRCVSSLAFRVVFTF